MALLVGQHSRQPRTSDPNCSGSGLAKTEQVSMSDKEILMKTFWKAAPWIRDLLAITLTDLLTYTCIAQWQVPFPKSVNVFPASGTNSQS
jgi:hypothetical protein